MTTSSLLIDRDGDVLRLTLNTPANGNLVDAEMGAGIVAALRDLDPQVRAVLLRGEGADFCAGRVSPTPPPGGKVPSAEQLRQKVALPALALYHAIKQAPVPTVCAVQGRAHGIGTALAAVCDLVIAGDDADFQVPELERDIPPTLVMSALADRVPLKTLSWLVLTRRSLDARQALVAGLVSHVVPAADLASEVEAVLATLAGTGAVALRACKQYLQLAPSLHPDAADALAGHLAGTALSARY